MISSRHQLPLHHHRHFHRRTLIVTFLRLLQRPFPQQAKVFSAEIFRENGLPKVGHTGNIH
jgi:hypothetical protein